MKRNRIIVSLAVLLAAVGVNAFAFHSGGVAECEGCHSMHEAASLDGNLMIASDPSSTCLNSDCHASPSPGTYHIFSAAANQTTPPVQYTPGGDFARHAPDVGRMAELAAQYLRAAGAETYIVETPGYPVVSGGWTADPSYPTVTVYNHMDVQPAQEPEWKQAPFSFQNDNGIYRGRGTTDDKGQALAALFGARYAIEQGVPINVRFLWELEEENGSPSFAAAIKNRAAIPCPDSVVISDTIWLSKNQPAMPYGLRGLLGARLVLRTGSKDAHSGVTGGAARNPLAELMDIVHACVDAKTGKVKIRYGNVKREVQQLGGEAEPEQRLAGHDIGGRGCGVPRDDQLRPDEGSAAKYRQRECTHRGRRRSSRTAAGTSSLSAGAWRSSPDC